ncbi:MAG: YbaN family protein [Bacilli bacterium]|nr:YbaN family protein [Bacilli bacterium]MBN2696203.1 YbaN family protein [Bacilli bacterium]
MKKMRKVAQYLYIMLGFTSLGVGSLGIFIPVLPTVPFYLLTAYFFAKGSDRFHNWFINTKIYDRYLKEFMENKSMTKKQKWTLLLFVDVVLVLTILLVRNPVITIILITIDVIKYIYFLTQVKTVK